MMGGRRARLRGLRHTFERNLAERRELGAAVAAYVGGEKVSTSGAHPRRPQRRTLGRGHPRAGVLDLEGARRDDARDAPLARPPRYDERVATYWPDFAQAGKEKVTVRQLLAHEAGLPVVDDSSPRS